MIFDSDSIVADLDERGVKAAVKLHPRQIGPHPLDKHIYLWRRLIEHFLCKPEEFERIAGRTDKTNQSFADHIYLNTTVIDS